MNLTEKQQVNAQKSLCYTFFHPCDKNLNYSFLFKHQLNLSASTQWGSFDSGENISDLSFRTEGKIYEISQAVSSSP